MPFDIKENFKGKKLTKISVHLHKISEREDATGTYTFEDGTTKEGGAYLLPLRKAVHTSTMC